ncbi:MAG: hypothetical protein AAGG68_20795 [Bacteroidota bacterium]
MKRKNDLHRLIRSMSKSEKRYFTLDAQKAGKKNAKYLRLFKAINALEHYSEAEIKQQFPKNLAADKTYLYDAILRSMRDYHSKKSRAAQIKEHLMDAKYLYERELYDLCEASLQSAKKLAEELGDHLSLLEINKQMRKVVKTTKKGIGEGVLLDLQMETKEVSTGLLEEFRTLNLYDNIVKNAVFHKQLSKDQIEDFKRNLSQLEVQKEKGFNSIHAEHRFYQTSGLYNHLVQDFDSFFEYFGYVMDWWDRNSEYKEEAFYNYIIDISTYLGACFRRERFDSFLELIERLEREEPSNTHHQKILFQRLYQYKLVYSINLGIVKGVRQIADDVELGLSRFSISQSTEKVLVLNMAILLFIAEEFDLCIEWSNRLINNTKSQIRLDIDRGIYFIKLISSYETDDFETFENTLRSANRFFNKEKDQYLSYYLKFLSKLKKLPDAPLDNQREVLVDLKKYIEDMRAEIKGRVPLVGIDEMTICWINSNLQRKSIAEVVKAEREN